MRFTQEQKDKYNIQIDKGVYFYFSRNRSLFIDEGDFYDDVVKGCERASGLYMPFASYEDEDISAAIIVSLENRYDVQVCFDGEKFLDKEYNSTAHEVLGLVHNFGLPRIEKTYNRSISKVLFWDKEKIAYILPTGVGKFGGIPIDYDFMKANLKNFDIDVNEDIFNWKEDK